MTLLPCKSPSLFPHVACSNISFRIRNVINVMILALKVASFFDRRERSLKVVFLRAPKNDRIGRNVEQFLKREEIDRIG